MYWFFETGEKPEWNFPASKQPSKGIFTYQSTANAIGLKFTADKFDYAYVEKSPDDISINVKVLGSKSAVSDGERQVIYHCGPTDGDALSSAPFKAVMKSMGLQK